MVTVLFTVVVTPFTINDPVTVNPPARVTSLSGAMVTAVARVLAEVPDEPAGAVWSTIEPPTPVPVPWPADTVRALPAMLVPDTAAVDMALFAALENFNSDRTTPH